MTAILSLKDIYIRLPDVDERRVISRQFEFSHELLGAVRVVDNTYCHKARRPYIDDDTYFTRKFYYSLTFNSM
jgi:hypothetical protein